MTAEECRRHMADLLLDIEDARGQTKLLAGPLRDWSKKLSALAVRMESAPLSLLQEDRETVARFDEIAALIRQAAETSGRLQELETRRRAIFGD